MARTHQDIFSPWGLTYTKGDAVSKAVRAETTSVTRKRLALGLLLIAAVGAVAWWVLSAGAAPLADVRGRIGTRSVSPVLARLREEHPDSAEVFLLSARQARLEDKADEASTHLARAERLGASKPAVERERTLARAASDPRRARPALDALLAADPGDADALLTLAQADIQSGRAEHAAGLADRVLRDSPANALALYVRGSAWTRARRLDLARADLEAAVAVGPDALAHRPAQVALGTCLLDLGEFARALEAFRAVRADEPSNLLALFGVGRASSYLGQWAEAEEAYQAVLKLRPGHVETLLGLAQVVEQRGDLDGALGYLEVAERGDPNRLETLSRLAKLLAARGQFDRARVYEERYRTLDPNRKPTGLVQQPKGTP